MVKTNLQCTRRICQEYNPVKFNEETSPQIEQLLPKKMGEKNSGFDVLYHNMKHGQDSSKEFSDFLRESCTIEESYAKLLAKLAKSASNWGTKGSFGPFWQVLKGLAEKLSNIHLQLVHAWADLVKDVQRYADEQIKKHKAVKDQEAGTLETVHSIQTTVVALQKTKEAYHARCLEYEKLKRDNASQKDIEKAEVKFRKANDEYKSMVEKYANIRNDFETKMLESCKHFQELEEYHLQQMKDFVDTYAKAWEHQHVVLGQVHQEFAVTSTTLTVDNLIQTFIQSKTTGKDVPGPIEFEEADLSTLPPAIGTPDSDKRDFPIIDRPKKDITSGESSSQSSPDNQPRTGPISLLDRTLPLRSSHGWFLNRRKKDKDKKKKKKEKDKNGEGDCEQKVPKVDDDGFSIRPENPLDNHNDNNSWYSSSDSDSDGEEKRKIKVEIKPFSPNGSLPQNNVDVIKKSIEGLRLSPTSNRRATPTMMDQNMKRSASVSDTISAATKPSQDLLGLDIFSTTASSSASTPTGGNYAFPSSMAMGGMISSSTMTTPVTTPMEDFSVGTSRSDTPPVLLNRINRSITPTGGAVSAPLLPGPPTRGSHRSNYNPNHAMARPPGRQSPALVNKTDSVPSLNNVPFNTSASSWSSRGPSPLTLGVADVVPIAVAFSETVNAYFKGSDESKCRVKVTGDMMMSFPAGIVRALTDNPSPALLSFRVKNTSSLEQLLVNKQLIHEDISQSTGDSKFYSFEMTALMDLLRRQTEQNRTASYFNIDIFKYQVRAKPGSISVPLHLVSYWKCETEQTDFRLDYRYNGAAMLGNQVPLSSLNILVPVDGVVSNMQSKPPGEWSAENKRAIWRIKELSNGSQQNNQGCIRAKFDLSGGPSTPSTTAIQFLSEGSTLSGIDFELSGPGYRVSLVKKRFITGKYISEAGS